MDPRDEPDLCRLDPMICAFRDQLIACLDECARGRQGLFASRPTAAEINAWPEAQRLRDLALALQPLLAQTEERDPLIDEFIDLCTIHGESDPGERRLARAFLDRIESGQVGTQAGEEPKPWS